MLNNTNPGYLPDGSLVPAVQNTLPPSSVPTIGDALNNKNISWAYFGGAYNDAVILSTRPCGEPGQSQLISAAALADPAHALGVGLLPDLQSVPVCELDHGRRSAAAAHIKDTSDLIADIKNNTLPAVSFGKPDGLLDGHPQSSKIDLFEAYVQNVLDALEPIRS